MASIRLSVYGLNSHSFVISTILSLGFFLGEAGGYPDGEVEGEAKGLVLSAILSLGFFLGVIVLVRLPILILFHTLHSIYSPL